GKELPAEFPTSRVEIVHLDDVARRIVDLDPVADPVRSLREDVDPPDEARHRGLDGETDDDGHDAERHETRVEVAEEARSGRAHDQNPREQADDADQVVSGDGALEPGHSERLCEPVRQKEEGDEDGGEREYVDEVAAL